MMPSVVVTWSVIVFIAFRMAPLSGIWFVFQALFDYQPSVNDVEMSQAWMATMEKAYTNLLRYFTFSLFPFYGKLPDVMRNNIYSMWDFRVIGVYPFYLFLILSNRLDESLCTAHLPRFFTSVMTYFLSEHTKLVKTASSTLKVFIKRDTGGRGVVKLCFAEW